MSGPKAWMPFYIADYLGDTSHLTAAQHGGYLMLIFHQWRTRKCLPNDDARLAQIARMSSHEWAENRDMIISFFTPVRDGLLQKRTQIEMERAEKSYKKRVKSVSEINNKRRRLSRSSLQSSTNNRHSIDPSTVTTTTTTKVVRGELVEETSPSVTGSGPSAQPLRTLPIPDPNVDVGGGVIFSINRFGICDLVTSPKDAVIPEFTALEAMALRDRAMASPPPAAPRHTVPVSRSEWYARTVVYYRTGQWPDTMPGSPPAALGCLAPPDGCFIPPDVIAEVQLRPEFNNQIPEH